MNPLVFEFDQGACPDHLLTRRQLRDRSLSPGRSTVVAILQCKGCRYTPQSSCTHRTRAYLYEINAATPKRVPTLAQELALDKAMAARQTCPGPCRRRYFHCLPLNTLGCCLECFDGTPADPTSYIAAPATHQFAA
ncbi:RRQRL motif-containing zinc-binding protein [Streptomyces sp. IBSBF 2806]|uniref:RRQRL motif-containing zinc-binding protein n=1 Tax=Streptomyces sp. IBSBF 2806 TaxID=2903529 RepID=UPI002FDBA795